jgi:hypothetical protein
VITELPRLPHLEAEQALLVGLQERLVSSPARSSQHRLIVPRAVAIEAPRELDAEESFTGPGAGQLSLESHQQMLKELKPAPQQLPLLPDPAPWEVDPEPQRGMPASSRLSRRRTKLGITPGQTTLF